MSTKQHNNNGSQQKLRPGNASNALDQSEKRTIEISPNQTVRQAVVNAGMAPSNQFDVFSSVGEVVTQKPVSNVEGETVYVGFARIAGGNKGVC